MNLGGTARAIALAGSTVGGGLTAVASGWGQTSTASSALPVTLQWVSLRTISNSECQQRLGGTNAARIGSTTICTFLQSGRGTCMGDSGGPLVVNNQLAGAVSWGIPCARGFPDMYARIDVLRTWILNTAR